MKRILGFAVVVALLAITSLASASPFWNTYQLTRAKWAAGVYVPDSAHFILEGNATATPACNDTTSVFYLGNFAPILGQVTGTNAYPLLRVSVSGVPTGVATDSCAAFLDYAMDKNGPWFTAGAAVPTGWDLYALKNSPTAASDTVGAGHTKYLYSTGSTAISPLSSQPVYSGCLNLTGVTIGSAVSSPIGWKYGRLRLTGDKTTGTINSLFDVTVWVTFPVDVAPSINPGEPQ